MAMTTDRTCGEDCDVELADGAWRTADGGRSRARPRPGPRPRDRERGVGSAIRHPSSVISRRLVPSPELFVVAAVVLLVALGISVSGESAAAGRRELGRHGA